MAKLNPYSLPRPERPVETKEFTEGKISFTLTLRAPDMPDQMRANEVTEQLWELYVTGSEDREVAPLPEPDIKISRPLFRFCALLAEMQAPEDPGDLYTALDLLVLSVKLPRAWEQVRRWADAIVDAWSAERPN
jgi:hypothetical protein